MTARLKARVKASSSPVDAPLKKGLRTAIPKPKEPWRAAPGQWCSFYYEGGHGERYWSGGWHCGVIREIPIKGQHKNWMRIEIMVDHYVREINPKTRRLERRMTGHDKPWVFGANVNELGDTVYHGLRLTEIVAERKEEKAKDVKKAQRKMRPKP